MTMPATGDSPLRPDFSGPWSWPGAEQAPSLFGAAEAKHPGIYLWTVPLQEGHLVYYVGETGRSFEVRMLEHFKEHCAGLYSLYEPGPFASGRRLRVWPGRYDAKEKRTAAECAAGLPALSPTIIAMAALYRFFLAPFDVERRLRQRAEAALADAFYEGPGQIGEFQERGIRYSRRKTEEPPLECRVAPASILGLPVRLTI